MPRIALAVVMVLSSLAALPVYAQPTETPRAPLQVDGATYAELNEATGILTLRGTPVTVRRGAMRLRAPAITYDTKRRILRASGGIAFADATLTVQAADVTVWLDEDRLQAAGGVQAVHEQGGEAVRLRAARLEMFGPERRAVASGAVELETSELSITGDRIEAALTQNELRAEGNARVVHQDIDGRAPRVLIRRTEGLAVLSGGAVVRQGPHEARAEEITVDLRRRRFTATGRASLVLRPSP